MYILALIADGRGLQVRWRGDEWRLFHARFGKIFRDSCLGICATTLSCAVLTLDVLALNRDRPHIVAVLVRMGTRPRASAPVSILREIFLERTGL